MKRVVVTGGAGFLGSHLCDRLVADGHDVICVDNLSTGSEDNIDHLRKLPRFHFMRRCILEPLDISGRVDEIYNMACPASPKNYQRDPHFTVMVNVVGVSNLLELARRKKARLLQSSTSEVYGDPLRPCQSEDDWGNVNCTGPRACYDEGKRCAEAMLFDAWRLFRQPVKVARIFNTYGPRMREDDGRVVSTFLAQIVKGEPITVYGDGSQTRSFCFVDDLVSGLLQLMATPDDFIGPVNLGNPEELSCLALAHRVAEVAGIRPQIVFHPLPVDDPRRRRPDISRATRVLGWKPSTPLDEGLRRSLAYYRARLTPQADARARKARGKVTVRDAAMKPVAI